MTERLCERCGQPIAAGLLERRPDTTRCADCQSRSQPAAPAPIPLPAPTTPPAPPPVAPEGCERGDPPSCFGQLPGEAERYRGLRPGGGRGS
jgi:hypothetical protein